MNRSIHIEYPSTLPDALHQTPAEFERQARLAIAVSAPAIFIVAAGMDWWTMGRVRRLG
jgi:hypothetical protein